MLKAQVTAAQEAYERHLESAKKEGNAWLTDGAGQFHEGAQESHERDARQHAEGNAQAHAIRHAERRR